MWSFEGDIIEGSTIFLLSCIARYNVPKNVLKLLENKAYMALVGVHLLIMPKQITDWRAGTFSSLKFLFIQILSNSVKSPEQDLC